MEDREPKPKRCPFMSCRSENVGVFATSHPKDGRGFLYWQGKCEDCGATGPARRTVEEAAIYWGMTDETSTTDDTAKRHEAPEPVRREVKVPLVELLDLVNAVVVYGYAHSVIMVSLAEFAGDVTDEEIEGFTKWLGREEEDREEARENLREWRARYAANLTDTQQEEEGDDG